MMKRINLILLFVILFSLLLSSCDKPFITPDDQTQAPPESRADTQPYREENFSEPFPIASEKKIELPQASLVFDRANARKGAEKSQKIEYIRPFLGDTFFVEYSGQIGDGYDGSGKYGIYTSNNKAFNLVGKLNNSTVSSGDCVIMHGRYFYTWYGSADADGADINNLIRIDAQEKQFTIVEKRKNVSMLINLSKLSEMEFIGYVPSQQGDSVVTEIEKYDGKTGKRKTILQNQFFYQEGEPDSRGLVLEAVCAADGFIYGLGRQRKSGDTHCYLYTYDGNGKLLSQREEVQINNGILEPMALYAAGSLLVVKDYATLRDSLFYRENGHYREVFDMQSNFLFAGNMENIWNSKKTPYLYFQHYDSRQDWSEIGKPVIYAANTETGAVTRLDIRTDEAYPYLKGMSMDESGNLALTFLKKEMDPDIRVYAISAATLRQVIESRP